MKRKRPMNKSVRHKEQWRSLTGKPVEQRRPVVIIVLLWDSTVFAVHLADRRGALPRDITDKVLIKQHLVYQVWLHQVWLSWRFWGPVVVS